MRRKYLNVSVIILQSIFLLCSFIPEFYTTDTEFTSDTGTSLWSSSLQNMKTGNGFGAAVFIVGLISPVLVMMILKVTKDNRKYISSAIAIFVSILSIGFFYYMATAGYSGEYHISMSFYILLGVEIASIVLCFIGFFTKILRSS